MSLPPESEDDNVEYKRLLSKEMLENDRMDSLITQMIWRTRKGDGISYYYLGINDNGTIYGLNSIEAKETISYFKKLVSKTNLDIASIKTHHVGNSKIYYQIILKEKCNVIPEIRVLIIGPEGSGKTTLVSALLHKQIDNGSGYLRNMILSHKHELFSGKSNSVTIKSINYSTCNITLIDTPSNLLENKVYFEKLALISNCCLVLCSPGDSVNEFINFVVNYDLPYEVINTKTSSGLDLTKEMPENFIFDHTKVYRELKPEFFILKQENKTIILSKLYSNDCIYLLTCVQISGSLKQGDYITFITKEITGRIESIQYMGCTLNEISSNVTFTCFIKTDQNIKKLKGEIFYSI